MSTTTHKFNQLPCCKFEGKRLAQLSIPYWQHRVLIEDAQGSTIRERARKVYRALRKTGHRLHLNNLYAPTPDPPLPTPQEMDRSSYWYRRADELHKLERLFLAAAHAYEFAHKWELADEYWDKAERVFVDRMDSYAAAVDLSWYEQRERDL